MPSSYASLAAVRRLRAIYTTDFRSRNVIFLLLIFFA